MQLARLPLDSIVLGQNKDATCQGYLASALLLSAVKGCPASSLSRMQPRLCRYGIIHTIITDVGPDCSDMQQTGCLERARSTMQTGRGKRSPEYTPSERTGQGKRARQEAHVAHRRVVRSIEHTHTQSADKREVEGTQTLREKARARVGQL